MDAGVSALLLSAFGKLSALGTTSGGMKKTLLFIYLFIKFRPDW